MAADTGGTKTTNLKLSPTGNSSSTITKSTVVTGTVAANDVLVIDTTTAGQVKRATVYGATGVFGIATGSGATKDVVIGGIYQVTADTAAVAIGDQLVTSSTTGQVTPTSSPSIGTSIGRALSSKAAGSSGTVWVQVTPGAGGSSGSGGMTKLYDTTLGADTANFDIQNIPSGYESLRVVFLGRTAHSATSDGIHLRFNNDSGANYYDQRVRGLGATASAAENLAATSGKLGVVVADTAGAGLASQATADIINYTSTDFRKTWASITTAPSAKTTGTIFEDATGGLWDSTSAINRITVISSNSANFKAGSRLVVYGIGPNSGGTAAGAGAGEISYTEFTSDVNVTASTEATANTIVTAPAYTYDGNTAVLVQFYAYAIWHTPANNFIDSFYLYDGSSSIGRIALNESLDNFIQEQGPILATYRITPSAGSHTFSVRAATGGITLVVGAGTGGNGASVPGYIRIIPAKGSGNATTLQGAYDMGRAITTTDARDISITLANTTTDSNFLVNVASSSTSKFALQNNGADAFSLSSTGDSANLINNPRINTHPPPFFFFFIYRLFYPHDYFSSKKQGGRRLFTQFHR